METLIDLLHRYPELALFICLGAGYWIGSFKVGRFGLGTVVGTLIVALIVGQAHIEVPAFLKTVFFLLFMFATGYHVGPQFFSGLRSGGLKMVAISLVFCFTGLAVVLLMAKVFGFDKGFASGLLSGGLTQSSVIGTATDAIERLPLPAEERRRLANHVPIADAVTYLFGTIGAALMLAKIGPRLIRINLRRESEQVERDLGGGGSQQKVFEAYAAVDLQAFRITPEKWRGETLEVLQRKLPARAFVQRVRRGTRLLAPDKNMVLEAGDVLVVSGPRQELIKAQAEVGEEVVDPEAMEIPFETVPVIVTAKSAQGRTIQELADRDPEKAKGVHLRRISRQGQTLPRLPQTRVERGDVLELVGRKEDLDRVIPLIGVADRPTEKSDLVFLSIACVLGILAGVLVIKLGGVPISLGTSGGVLVAGLLFGWLHSVRPQYGRIPAPAVWLMETLGLNTFVAVVGLAAGPHAVEAMKDNGASLVLAGVAVTLVPHLVTILFGRHVLKMNGSLLMGACAGAGTVVAALQAVQDDAESTVPALGFTVPYALSNVLLTAWGPLIVALV